MVKGLITKLVKNPKKRSQIKESMQKESEKLDEILRKIYEENNLSSIDKNLLESALGEKPDA